MAKKSVPVIEVAPRIALLSDDLLPSIKAPASARHVAVFFKFMWLHPFTCMHRSARVTFYLGIK
jgi:hypothetical protein